MAAVTGRVGAYAAPPITEHFLIILHAHRDWHSPPALAVQLVQQTKREHLLLRKTVA